MVEQGSLQHIADTMEKKKFTLMVDRSYYVSAYASDHVLETSVQYQGEGLGSVDPMLGLLAEFSNSARSTHQSPMVHSDIVGAHVPGSQIDESRSKVRMYLPIQTMIEIIESGCGFGFVNEREVLDVYDILHMYLGAIEPYIKVRDPQFLSALTPLHGLAKAITRGANQLMNRNPSIREAYNRHRRSKVSMMLSGPLGKTGALEDLGKLIDDYLKEPTPKKQESVGSTSSESSQGVTFDKPTRFY